MKHRLLLAAGLMCYLLFSEARAQNPLPFQQIVPEKSLLFGSLPEQFSIANLWIEKLFFSADSERVQIPLTIDRYFEGVVMEKVQNNPHVITINVKSTNYDGALLSISKITNTDRTIKYIGRIMNIRYGDVILLVQENNTLSFKRKKQNLVITE